MITIYTDGGCLDNGKLHAIGAYAFLIVKDGEIIYEEAVRIEATCTNNISELTACIKALQYCKDNDLSPDELYSDSKYCIDGITLYLDAWIRSEFKQGIGDRPNTQLWKQYVTLRPYFRRKLNYIWVKGHAGNPFNERCDQLCSEAMGIIPSKPVKKARKQLFELPIAAYSIGHGTGIVSKRSDNTFEFKNEKTSFEFTNQTANGISAMVPIKQII